MRFTFVILLFLSLGADAQMIIKAHANYRPYAVVAQNLLLDDYPNAAAAYSLRKLDKDYTGSAIRVRRSNDNSEQDIGFTSSGDLDTGALKSFVGANSGFVTTWYNQADSAGVFGIRNATQSTAAGQPRIVNAGVVDRENSKPSIKFDGSNDRLVTANTIFNSSPISIFSFIGTHTNVRNEFFGERITGDRGWHYAFLATSGEYYIANENSGNYITYLKSVYKHLATILRASNHSYTLYHNGISVGTQFGTNLYNTTTGGGFTIGSDGATSPTVWSNAYISEIVGYTSSQSSNRTGIETNINSYYGIY